MMADGRRVVGYNNQPNISTEYRRFNSDYYSGADVRIYFRDIWIDEINNLQFTLQENVAPIFGYCSTTWDKVARGTRHVQGSFTINFKESYYLHSVIERLESSMKDDDGDGNYESNGFSQDSFKEGSTIEHLLKSNGSNFDILADKFEDSLWGKSDNATINSRRDKRAKSSFFYGDGSLKDTGFNILLSYGPLNEADGRKVNETVHSLVGVQLTGVSQIIGLDGRPIEEQYQFIAKDLDANVAKTWG
jgi:hypothetical protein